MSIYDLSTTTEWRWTIVARGAEPANWNQPGFDDSSWNTGNRMPFTTGIPDGNLTHLVPGGVTLVGQTYLPGLYDTDKVVLYRLLVPSGGWTAPTTMYVVHIDDLVNIYVDGVFITTVAYFTVYPGGNTYAGPQAVLLPAGELLAMRVPDTGTGTETIIGGGATGPNNMDFAGEGILGATALRITHR